MDTELLTKQQSSSKSIFINLPVYCKWWPLLLPLAAMLSVYIAYHTGHTGLYAKNPHEVAAMFLLPVVFVLFLIRAVAVRHKVHILLTALSGAFFLREWHFAGTSKGIYIALALLGICAWLGVLQKARFFQRIFEARKPEEEVVD